MSAPAFQFYPSDYLSDERVMLMSLEEEGIYIRLLCLCWREGSIPDDDSALSRMCKGASVEALRVVKGCFNRHPENASRLIHPRLEVEREKQRLWREKSSSGGKKSAEMRACARTKLQSNNKAGSRVVQPMVNGACKVGSTLLSSFSSSKENGNEVPIPSELSSLPEFPELWRKLLTQRKKRKWSIEPEWQAERLALFAQRPSQTATAFKRIFEANWQGFKWEWLEREGSIPTPSKTTPSTPPISTPEYLQWLNSQDFGDRMKPEWRNPETAPRSLVLDFLEYQNEPTF